MVDQAVAVGSFALFTLPVAVGVRDGEGSAVAVTALGLLANLPLLLRRRAPMLVLAAVTVVMAVASVVGVRFTPFVSNAGPALAIAVFTVADRRARSTSLPAAAAAAAVTGAAALTALVALHTDQDQNLVAALVVTPAWLVGDAVRSHRRYRHELATENQRRQAEHSLRLRAEERLRLSRDVHDVVSHTLSMIAVRSGVARHLLDSRPDEARSALVAIETASRDAMTELRTVLRRTREPSPSGEAPTGDAWATPVLPTLADLPTLVTAVRHDGLDVTFHETGRPRRHDATIETSVYRVVQEALTNVLRHANATAVTVEVDHGEDVVTARVVDNGAGPEPDDPPAGGGAGVGLVGMRERCELFGGTVEVGPREDSPGYRVVARLPTRPASGERLGAGEQHPTEQHPDVD